MKRNSHFPALLRFSGLFFLTIFFLSTAQSGLHAQKKSLLDVVARKWKVIWYSDDGDQKNMEAKKQILIMRRDGTGEMFMMGEKVGDVTWSVTGKKTIDFQDVPDAPPYNVKVSKYKKGTNMLFAGEMPNGVLRKVYFQALAGNTNRN